MFNKFLLILILSPWILSCQNSLIGELTPPKDYSFVILYKLTPTGKVYVQDTKVDNGEFKLNLDSNLEEGSYRLVYNLPEEENFFDLILSNKENVSLSFSETKGIVFNKGQNKILMEYLVDMSEIQQEINSRISSPTSTAEEIESLLTRQSEIQTKAENDSKDFYASTLIKSLKPFITDNYTNKEVYEISRKSNFFSDFDFEDTQLQSSPFPLEKIKSYYHEFVTMKGGVNYQSAINDIHLAIKDASPEFQKHLLESFWQSLLNNNRTNAANYLGLRYLITLANTLEDKELSEKLQRVKSLSIGEKAPNFTLSDFDNSMSLYDLEGSEFYILAFWSTECSHCLKHIPELHEKMKTVTSDKIKVVAIGLEIDEETWRERTKELPDFIHVLAKDDALTELARIYDIKATPTFYVLNEEKRIAAKPRGLQSLYIGIEASAEQ